TICADALRPLAIDDRTNSPKQHVTRRTHSNMPVPCWKPRVFFGFLALVFAAFRGFLFVASRCIDYAPIPGRAAPGEPVTSRLPTTRKGTFDAVFFLILQTVITETRGHYTKGKQ